MTDLIKKEKIFFPNLDGLRFFSFLVVFFAHIFVTDYDYIKNQGWYKIFKVKLFHDGDIGVSFFFVLSGFLISYLLIKEKEYTGRIHVFSFYIRRALRIWPLYYFMVLFGFIAFPFLKSLFGEVPNETADPVLCSVFLNNFDRIVNGPPDSSVLSVLWSVAIEEQFYLFWPLLFFLVPPRFYFYIFIVIISGSIVFRTMFINESIELLTPGVIGDMAIGGLAAYLSIKSKRFLKMVENSNKFLNIIPYLAAVLFLVYKYEIFFNPFLIVTKRAIISFFFAWIILEQNFCKNSLFKISSLKTVTQLGKYTYGLYCLHRIAILIVMTIMQLLGINKHAWQLWVIEFPACLLLSIVLSYYSYKYFESYFLKLKDKFAYIVKR
ncbi:MAG TPA: acyltransferase [Chitinophagaceae bacterium]|nr:acyltransferase [Chitinophagaceae bacterium]